MRQCFKVRRSAHRTDRGTRSPIIEWPWQNLRCSLPIGQPKRTIVLCTQTPNPSASLTQMGRFGTQWDGNRKFPVNLEIPDRDQRKFGTQWDNLGHRRTDSIPLIPWVYPTVESHPAHPSLPRKNVPPLHLSPSIERLDHIPRVSHAGQSRLNPIRLPAVRHSCVGGNPDPRISQRRGLEENRCLISARRSQI